MGIKIIDMYAEFVEAKRKAIPKGDRFRGIAKLSLWITYYVVAIALFYAAWSFFNLKGIGWLIVVIIIVELILQYIDANKN